jgi:hypothetical protein
MIVTGLMYTSKGGDQLYKRFLIVGGSFFAFALIAALVYGKPFMTFVTICLLAYMLYKLKTNRHVLNTILLSFTVLLIGYSSFFTLVIRSQANTPMDENNPENAISLLSYLNREQYGDWPIAYGPYFNAPLDDENPADDGNPVYALDEQSGEYVVDHFPAYVGDEPTQSRCGIRKLGQHREESHEDQADGSADRQNGNVQTPNDVVQSHVLLRLPDGPYVLALFQVEFRW